MLENHHKGRKERDSSPQFSFLKLCVIQSGGLFPKCGFVKSVIDSDYYESIYRLILISDVFAGTEFFEHRLVIRRSLEMKDRRCRDIREARTHVGWTEDL